MPEGIIVGIAADAHSIKVTATDVVELYRPCRARGLFARVSGARGKDQCGSLAARPP
jgi:hypothetical protein